MSIHTLYYKSTYGTYEITTLFEQSFESPGKAEQSSPFLSAIKG